MLKLWEVKGPVLSYARGPWVIKISLYISPFLKSMRFCFYHIYLLAYKSLHTTLSKQTRLILTYFPCCSLEQQTLFYGPFWNSQDPVWKIFETSKKRRNNFQEITAHSGTDIKLIQKEALKNQQRFREAFCQYWVISARKDYTQKHIKSMYKIKSADRI